MMIDWERIEAEYRAGQLSVAEIGRLHGVSHTAINKKAKKNQWTRDLTQQVRQAASARLVSSEVSTETLSETVDQAAARVVAVVRSHRKDIGACRELAAVMFEELREASDFRLEIAATIDEETKGSPRRREQMLKATSLCARASVLLNLSAAMKNFVGLERQAFSIDSNTPTQGSLPIDKMMLDELREYIASEREHFAGSAPELGLGDAASALAGGPGEPGTPRRPH